MDRIMSSTESSSQNNDKEEQQTKPASIMRFPTNYQSWEEIAEWKQMRNPEYWQNLWKAKENVATKNDALKNVRGDGDEKGTSSKEKEDRLETSEQTEKRISPEECEKSAVEPAAMDESESSYSKSSGAERSQADRGSEVSSCNPEKRTQQFPASSSEPPLKKSKVDKSISRTKSKSEKDYRDHFRVDKVLTSKINRGPSGNEICQYFVSWCGYDKSHNQYTDEKDFWSMLPVESYWKDVLTWIQELNKPKGKVDGEVTPEKSGYFFDTL